ncbi:hypothetical protein DL769_000198 [Monosporascus sp. CRB-8-3]|nr:hypothetical protein DL769_000198 [Monosporascus sp. CRB-8-3]
MATGKGTASGKDVGGQPEGFDMEQLMKAFATKKKDTHLDWKYFDFKLSEENRLRGSDNWEMWKTAIWVALMAIGYRDGDSAKLSHIDEAKLAAAVVANVKEAPMAVVTGLTKGTEMIKVLERSYGAKGIDQKMDLWTQLQFAKWDPKKQSALDHVVDFKNLVRRCNEVDMPVNAGQQVTMFINSIRDHDGDWKGRMRGMLRQHPTMTVNQVYDDFVAEFRGKEKDSKKGSGNSYNAKQNRRDKPVWNKEGQPLCFICGEYGYMAKDCPKRRNDSSDERSKRGAECEASFIPEGLQDLYRTDGKTF